MFGNMEKQMSRYVNFYLSNMLMDGTAHEKIIQNAWYF